MYGLILQILCDTLKQHYGDMAVEEIKRVAGVSQIEFCTTKVYSETIIPRMTKAATAVTGASEAQVMETFGASFFQQVNHYGYGKILKVLGRNMRDFLNGLDNLHAYLQFTYPKLRPPSFFCEDETKTGLTLHYRSRRKGFLYYVMGQIRTVGRHFYQTDVDIQILKEEVTQEMTHVTMRLSFDNQAYGTSDPDEEVSSLRRLCDLELRSEVLFDVFPFHVVFDRAMRIQNTGSGLSAVVGDIVGRPLDETFTLVRPLISFTLDNILMYSNNVFELKTSEPIRRRGLHSDNNSESQTGLENGQHGGSGMNIVLKGQMILVQEWDAFMYLATPVMENLDCMFEAGLYINDLSMHDSSRDLVLAATQQSAELKLALDQEKRKNQILEESMSRLDEEMRHTDSLLYQMIPKTVADRLRNGEPAVSTCEVFDSVTILFSDVVGFTRICSQISPMAVVSMLNSMYTAFDKLSEKHHVYKVETIGDAYMVVSGAPTVITDHAPRAGDMALDMLGAMRTLIEPSSGKHMQIRIGLHSGTVVAGVVGNKMPRYCLFGETVNTASKMENNGEAMKINMSDSTFNQLDKACYDVAYHRSLDVKNKSSIQMYWLLGRAS